MARKPAKPRPPKPEPTFTLTDVPAALERAKEHLKTGGRGIVVMGFMALHAEYERLLAEKKDASNV